MLAKATETTHQSHGVFGTFRLFVQANRQSSFVGSLMLVWLMRLRWRCRLFAFKVNLWVFVCLMMFRQRFRFRHKKISSADKFRWKLIFFVVLGDSDISSRCSSTRLHKRQRICSRICARLGCPAMWRRRQVGSLEDFRIWCSQQEPAIKCRIYVRDKLLVTQCSEKNLNS